MGWSSGGELADEIWEIISGFVPKRKQAQVAAEIIDIFENHDCDTMYETELWEVAGFGPDDDDEDEDEEESDD